MKAMFSLLLILIFSGYSLRLDGSSCTAVATDDSCDATCSAFLGPEPGSVVCTQKAFSVECKVLDESGNLVRIERSSCSSGGGPGDPGGDGDDPFACYPFTFLCFPSL